ncbi:MAG: threonine ammonia-lyase [Thermoplasmataceae archaeon]
MDDELHVQPTMDDFIAAQDELKGKINRTPLYHSTWFSKTYNSDIFFKMENFQKTGSFKARGAIFRVSKLSAEERKRGVITASAGNHAQGVAYAALINDIGAKIVMPEHTVPAKVNAVMDYKAQVVLSGIDYNEAKLRAEQIRAVENRTFIDAFNDRWIISGQGTIGLEILEDQPEIDMIIVPIGGGGLISGIAMAAKMRKPDIKIVGVQSEQADSMRLSVAAGKIVPYTSTNTIADGISVKFPGELNLRIVQKYVDDIVTVNDESIAMALYKLLERSKVLVEPSGAAALAAIMEGKVNVTGKKVAVIVSGGNANLLLLSKIIYKAMELESRLIRIDFQIPDRPGTLMRIATAVSSVGGNIYHAQVDNMEKTTPVGFQSIRFTVNVRGRAHADELVEKLKSLGYQFEVEK